MKKLSLKKSVLSLMLAGLLLTGFAKTEKTTLLIAITPTSIVETIIETIKQCFSKIMRLILPYFQLCWFKPP